MINPQDEIIIDLSTSCTKEVAVAKLLGWMKGPILAKEIKVTEHGISEDQLPFLQSMEDSLQEQLLELRETARQDLVAAAEADATYEVLKEKEESVTNIDLLIHNAFKFMSGIDEELSKDDNSEIIVDKKTSKEKGTTYITLKSVDQWAKNKYGISILDDPGQHRSPEDTSVLPIMQDKEENLDTENGLNRIDAESFLTTFAFLVEAFHKISIENDIIKFGKDSPNVKAISDHLEGLARTANNNETLKGQKDQSIKKRINRAMEIKKAKLPQR